MMNYEGRRVKMFIIAPEVILSMFKNDRGGIWAVVKNALPNDAELIDIKIASDFGTPPTFCMLVESSEYDMLHKEKRIPEGESLCFLNIPECHVKFDGELSLNEYIAARYPELLKDGG